MRDPAPASPGRDSLKRLHKRADRVPRAAHALLLACILLPLLPALPLPTAEAQTGSGVTINVVSARSLGCSPDRVTQPDLRVRVLVNDAEALVTEKASDQADPVFGAHATLAVPTGARIRVEVHEAEPGGFFLLGTDWVDCDTAQGAGGHHNHTYGGGAAERIVARGDGPTAAEAIVIVGRPTAPAPTARVAGVGTTNATLAWTTPAGAQATGFRVAHAGVGAVIATLPPDATHAELTGLCDNQEYALRILRASDPWLLASPDVELTTANAAPKPARVLRADATAGNATVSWESATRHDVRAFEVHAAANAAFTPSASTLRGTADPGASTLTFPLRQGEAHVRVRTLDTGGLDASSPSFPLGAPAQEDTFPPLRDDCFTITVDGARTPTPATTTPTTTPAGTTPTGTTAATTPVGTTPPPTRATTEPTTTTTPTSRASDRDDGIGGVGDTAGESIPTWFFVTIALVLGVAVGGLLVALARR